MRVDVDEPRLDLGDAFRIGRIFGFAEERGALGVGREHEVDQRLRAAGRLLLDAAEPRAFRNRDRAALRREFAANEAEERGLAGAVAPDEPHPRAARQRDGGVVD